MTMRYAHLSDKARAEGIAQLEQWREAEEAESNLVVGHFLDTHADSD